MAKKIEGWISEWWRRYGDTEKVYEFRHVDPPAIGSTPCTLVIHEGYKIERVLTMSEVQAMLDAVDTMEQFTGAQVQMLKEYGIFKDPA